MAPRSWTELSVDFFAIEIISTDTDAVATTGRITLLMDAARKGGPTHPGTNLPVLEKFSAEFSGVCMPINTSGELPAIGRLHRVGEYSPNAASLDSRCRNGAKKGYLFDYGNSRTVLLAASAVAFEPA